MAQVAESTTIVLDLGSKSRKQVKKLRKGGGPLLAKVDATVDQLKAAGELGDGTVVVVVKQKPKKSKLWKF